MATKLAPAQPSPPAMARVYTLQGVVGHTLTLGCLVMLVTQVVFSVVEYMEHTTVQTRDTVSITDIDFPDIVICHKQGFDMSNQIVYENVVGMSPIFPTDLLGWCHGVGNASCFEFLASFANMRVDDIIF